MVISYNENTQYLDGFKALAKSFNWNDTRYYHWAYFWRKNCFFKADWDNFYQYDKNGSNTADFFFNS